MMGLMRTRTRTTITTGTMTSILTTRRSGGMWRRKGRKIPLTIPGRILRLREGKVRDLSQYIIMGRKIQVQSNRTERVIVILLLYVIPVFPPMRSATGRMRGIRVFRPCRMEIYRAEVSAPLPLRLDHLLPVRSSGPGLPTSRSWMSSGRGGAMPAV